MMILTSQRGKIDCCLRILSSGQATPDQCRISLYRCSETFLRTAVWTMIKQI